MPIVAINAWQQKSWWATMGLMGKRTKNIFLDMKKWLRKEVRSSNGTSIIDPLPLSALHIYLGMHDFGSSCTVDW